MQTNINFSSKLPMGVFSFKINLRRIPRIIVSLNCFCFVTYSRKYVLNYVRNVRLSMGASVIFRKRRLNRPEPSFEELPDPLLTFMSQLEFFLIIRHVGGFVDTVVIIILHG